MKINQLLEGYYKTLDIERQEDRRLGRPVVPTPEPENNKYHLELWYDRTGYLVTTVAKTLKQAEAQALFRVKKYLKSHYPRYDVTGLIKRDVRIVQVPEEQYKARAANLLVI